MRLQRTLIVLIGLAVAVLLTGGCATFESRPAPLTREEIVQMSKAGEAPPAIIERLRQTDTVLLMSASDIVKLAEAGVPGEVLDYLQTVQIAEIRRRDQFNHMMMYGPYSPFGHCAGASRYPDRIRSPFFPYWPYC